MVCSLPRGNKLLMKKSVNIDLAETLGALLDRLKVATSRRSECAQVLLAARRLCWSGEELNFHIRQWNIWMDFPAICRTCESKQVIHHSRESKETPTAETSLRSYVYNSIIAQTLFRSEADLILSNYCNIYTFVFAWLSFSALCYLFVRTCNFLSSFREVDRYIACT